MHGTGSHSDIDDDELFAELEAEIENDDNAAVRERGIQQFKQEMERLKKLKENGHGRYDEILEEKLVLQTTIQEPLCIVHFYMPNFRRCTIMDKHLERLAPKYFNTRFLRVCVENVPFLVEKLGIKVLPAVYCFVKGVAKTRLVGFEDLGNKDNFETSVLERKLLDTGVIKHEQDDASQHTYTTATTTVRQNVRGGPSKDDFEFDL
ncbi:thioredoxin-like protein [Irpex rosettiformis]|uniref:Thioredoxin-like protein n=1 Tax=Irpex rosettiformis TaxID=378272 RepID=A0ACB8UCR4_9APHY|nr:thioredoxin-like protein [Irpex rosettiformis]